MMWALTTLSMLLLKMQKLSKYRSSIYDILRIVCICFYGKVFSWRGWKKKAKKGKEQNCCCKVSKQKEGKNRMFAESKWLAWIILNLSSCQDLNWQHRGMVIVGNTERRHPKFCKPVKTLVVKKMNKLYIKSNLVKTGKKWRHGRSEKRLLFQWPISSMGIIWIWMCTLNTKRSKISFHIISIVETKSLQTPTSNLWLLY